MLIFCHVFKRIFHKLHIAQRGAGATPRVDFGELRSLAACAPGRDTWGELVRLFERARHALPGAEIEGVWVPYARDVLRGWPAGLRVCPARWLRDALEGEARVELELVDELDFDVLEVLPARTSLRRLSQCAHLRFVTGVRIPTSCDVREGALVALLSQSVWGAPERIHLGGVVVSRACVEAIALAQPRRLSLRGCHLEDGALAVLIEAGAFTRAERLELVGGRGEIERAGVLSELLSVCAGRLEHLNLGGTRCGGELVRALAMVPLPSLRGLGLSSCGVDVNALDGIEHIEALDLSYNRFSVAGAMSLATRVKSLRVLDVSGCFVGVEPLAMLAQRGALSCVEVLLARENFLGGSFEAGWSEGLRALRELWLERNGVTEQDLEVLLGEELAGLVRLELGGAFERRDVLARLASASLAGGLEELSTIEEVRV